MHLVLVLIWKEVIRMFVFVPLNFESNSEIKRTQNILYLRKFSVSFRNYQSLYLRYETNRKIYIIYLEIKHEVSRVMILSELWSVNCDLVKHLLSFAFRLFLNFQKLKFLENIKFSQASKCHLVIFIKKHWKFWNL